MRIRKETFNKSNKRPSSPREGYQGRGRGYNHNNRGGKSHRYTHNNNHNDDENGKVCNRNQNESRNGHLMGFFSNLMSCNTKSTDNTPNNNQLDCGEKEHFVWDRHAFEDDKAIKPITVETSNVQ